MLTVFENAYQGMREKWVLTSSGRAVEDVIYQACGSMDVATFKASLLRIWILDLKNHKVRALFTSDERAEIKQSQSDLPPWEKSLPTDWFTRFQEVTSTDELQKVLDLNGWRPNGVVYDKTVHAIPKWADVTIRRLYVLPFINICYFL